MSIWSRSHTDLALLAKTMQARNDLTRQRLAKRHAHDEKRKDTSVGNSSVFSYPRVSRKEPMNGSETEFGGCSPPEVCSTKSIEGNESLSCSDHNDISANCNCCVSASISCLHTSTILNNQLDINQDAPIFTTETANIDRGRELGNQTETFNGYQAIHHQEVIVQNNLDVTNNANEKTHSHTGISFVSTENQTEEFIDQVTKPCLNPKLQDRMINVHIVTSLQETYEAEKERKIKPEFNKTTLQRLNKCRLVTVENTQLMQNHGLKTVEDTQLMHNHGLETLKEQQLLHNHGLETLEEQQLMHNHGLKIVEDTQLLHNHGLESVENPQRMHNHGLETLKEQQLMHNHGLKTEDTQLLHYHGLESVENPQRMHNHGLETLKEHQVMHNHGLETLKEQKLMHNHGLETEKEQQLMHNHGLETIKDQQLTNSCRLETVDAPKKSEISSPFSESVKEVSLQQNSSHEYDLNEAENLTESIRPHCINSSEFVQQVHPMPGLDLNGQMIRDCDVGHDRLVESCLNTETPNDFNLILPNSLFEILPSCLSKTSYVPNVREATLVKDLSNIYTVEREVKDDQDVPGDLSVCLMSNSPAFCAYAERPMDLLVKTPIKRMDPSTEPSFLDYETAHDVPCAINTSSADSLSSILNVTLEQIQAVLAILPNPSGCNDQLSHSSKCMSIHSCPHLNTMFSHPFSRPITLANINTYSPLSPLLGQSCETLLTFSTNLRMSSRLDELNRNFLQSVNSHFLQLAFSPMNVNSSDVESNFSDTFHENVQIISDNWDKSQSACAVQHIENSNPTMTYELSEWASLPLKLNQINTEQICTECYYPEEENSHVGTFYGLEISPKHENCYKNLSNEKSSIAPCEDCSNSTIPAFDINKFCLDVEVVNHKPGDSHLASVRKYSEDHDHNLQQLFSLFDHCQKEYTEIENMPIINSTGIHCKKDSGEFESIKTKPSDSSLLITSDVKDSLTCHMADINLSESYLNNVEYQTEHGIDCIRPFKSCQVISTKVQSNHGCLIGFSDAQVNPCDTQSIHNVEHSSTSSDRDLPSGCCRTVCEKFKDSIINETNINCKCQTKVVNLKTSLASPSSEETGSSIVSTLSETEEAFLSLDASANEADVSSEQSSADLSSQQSSAAAVFSHNALYTSHTDGEVPDAASDGLLSLLSTLRVLQHKLSQGNNLRQCALLLPKLELAREFLVLNKSPTFVAIQEDLKLLCQTLARLISSSKRRLFISERSIDYRSDGHKVSTKQRRSYHHNKSKISQRLKPNSYEINFGTIKKVHTTQETDNKKRVLMLLNNRSHKRSSLQTKDGDYFNLPSPSVTNSIKLEYKSSQNPNCYGLDHTGFSESSSQESITTSDTWSNWTNHSNLTNMESDSALESQLDREFDKYLADMKPHVLKLPQKTERQKCAVWIKKLCEPVRGGVSARKTRNLYAQLMLQMLKKGSWDSPFDQKPESGALKPLPSYLIEKLPDWVEGELAETVGSSIFAKTLGIPAATSTRVSNSAEFLERPHTSMGHTLEKDPSLSLSPIRHTEGTQPRYSADDLSIELQRSPKISHRHQKGHHHSLSGDREKRLLPDVRVKESRENDKVKEVTISESDWSKPYSSTTSSTYSLLKGTTFYDDPSFLKPADREIAMRAKVIEAKFHEEKLKLQQRHDTAVQKILDRKNLEIEDMKNLYKAKTKDLEDTIDKLERKVQNLIKETEFIKQSKDKQIAELKKIADDSNETRKNDYEKKLHELVTEFEQEKFDLQKQHTQNIQEILDDTNDRLQRMEAEYTNQTNITTDVIKELESRIQQLMNEVDSSLNQRSAVEKEKNDVLIKCEKLSNENERLRERLAQQERDQRKIIEAQEHEIKSLKNKTEASLEYLRQEHSMATSKAADTIKDLEEKIEQLKKSLKDSEEQRQRLIRAS
ncbi:centrosomal protein of 112 kDa [Biomphalaria pfeifferi]|uniref:Centrosomal protein of 112 kDa n=1 Tax=Biomphalaria pfeifferi TaxID=112525 RepID=A0AAD8B805_BIOPF|nr:centrosomal protein of 112 kDa [Biomphalaria pfeifferi]